MDPSGYGWFKKLLAVVAAVFVAVAVAITVTALTGGEVGIGVAVGTAAGLATYKAIMGSDSSRSVAAAADVSAAAIVPLAAPPSDSPTGTSVSTSASVHVSDVPLGPYDGGGDVSSDMESMVAALGVSPGLATDALVHALLPGRPSRTSPFLRQLEGAGWIGLGIAISLLDGPAPFADAGGAAVAALGLEELQAALTVGTSVYGISVLEGDGVSQVTNYRRGHSELHPVTLDTEGLG